MQHEILLSTVKESPSSTIFLASDQECLKTVKNAVKMLGKICGSNAISLTHLREIHLNVTPETIVSDNQKSEVLGILESAIGSIITSWPHKGRLYEILVSCIENNVNIFFTHEKISLPVLTLNH